MSNRDSKASFTLSGTPHIVVIPLLYNGSSRIGLFALLLSSSQLGGPFDFCAFALLSELTAQLSGNRFEVYSSSSAFYVCYWAVFYDGGEDVSRMKMKEGITIYLLGDPYLYENLGQGEFVSHFYMLIL